MGQPAAKQGDRIVAIDTHLIQSPRPVSPVPVPHPLSGVIDGDFSADAKPNGPAAATLGNAATNTPRIWRSEARS
jgi:hypothetical protein